MRRQIQVLVIDGAGLIREGLCALLGLETDIQILGAHDLTAEVNKIAVASEPDVVIMNFAMPANHGAAMITALRRRWEGARLLVLAFRCDKQIIEAAIRAGADDYLLETHTARELMASVRKVVVDTPEASRVILDPILSGQARKRTTAKRRDSDGLSERERDVIKRIAQGYRTREIAEQLSLSHKTIEKHRSNLMRKLRLRSATAVAAYAITNGYLDL